MRHAISPSAEADALAAIDSHLRERLATLEPAALADAAAYATLGPGKRTRPLLAWHACAAAGGDPRRSLWAGAAVEFVHAFSLAHDDLPALDNDDLRRGRPTLHKAFGEAMAILAGDALLNLAYGQTPPGRAGALASRILHDAVAAMIAGQVLDTIPASRNPSLRGVDSVRAVHERKTGALIKASVMLGGLAGLSAHNPDPSESELDPFSRFGAAVGLMFQIVDDLLDVLGDSAHVGKATGKDAAAGKLTYPSVLGVEGSRREVERLGEEATAALARMPGDVSGLKNLCNALVHRTK